MPIVFNFYFIFLDIMLHVPKLIISVVQV